MVVALLNCRLNGRTCAQTYMEPTQQEPRPCRHGHATQCVVPCCDTGSWGEAFARVIVLCCALYGFLGALAARTALGEALGEARAILVITTF